MSCAFRLQFGSINECAPIPRAAQLGRDSLGSEPNARDFHHHHLGARRRLRSGWFCHVPTPGAHTTATTLPPANSGNLSLQLIRAQVFGLVTAASVARADLLRAHTTSRVLSTQCLAADAHSANLIAVVTGLINATDPDETSLRDAAGLGGVSPSSLVLVTSAMTCARAATAVDKMAKVSNSGRLVYVVQAASHRFIVQDPNATAGEYWTVLIFDQHFTFIMSLLQ